MLTWDQRGASWRRLQRAFVWLLLVSVPAFGLSETLTQLLGPRHFHSAAPSAPAARPASLIAQLKALPWVAELRGMRERAHAQSHAHPPGSAHSQWARHTHAHADDSVVPIDPITPDDGASTEPAASVWAFSGGLRHALPSPLRTAWPLGHAAAFRSRVARRLDRPPKR